MTLAIMQPYFMPYIGYWQLMAAVDTYVVYDDVNYIKGGWVSRNRILMNGEPHLFTIKLSGASQNKHFNEITVLDDFVKFRKTLKLCYGKAPYYAEVMHILEDVFAFGDRTLSVFIYHSFLVIKEYLEMDTKLILSSSLDKNNSLRGAEKVKHICQLLVADTYINAIGGRELYDVDDFASQGIALKFVKTNSILYSQFSDVFIPNLSIIDVLMFNGKEGTKQLLKEYTLV